MSGNYTEVYYHIVWPTKNREAFIDSQTEAMLYAYLGTLCKSMQIRVYALNGMPDHVHLACSVPPTMSVSQAIKDLKGKSSHFINHLSGDKHFLAWQPGYGLLTFAKANLDTVVKYIQNQKAHHAEGSLKQTLERWEALQSPEGTIGQ